jgi:hypothetical protein
MVETRNSRRNVAAATFTTPPRHNRRQTQQTPSSAVSVASVASETSRSTTTSARSRNPLPNHLQSQLAEDIEAYGGIQTHIGKSNSCYHLLNHLIHQDPVALALYKDNRHPIRRKISQKVYRWQKKYEEGTYEEEVLKPFNVKPASQRDSILQITSVDRTLSQDLQGDETASTQGEIPSSVSFISSNPQEEEQHPVPFENTNVSSFVIDEEEEEEYFLTMSDSNTSNNRLTLLHLKQPWRNPNDIFVLTGERSKKNDEQMAT